MSNPFSSWTAADVDAFNQRTHNRANPPMPDDHSVPAEAVDLEGKLHGEIILYCNAQYPRWKVIHSRMDQRSTIAAGAQDFTIFVPAGRTICVECKAKGKKRTPEQLAWAKEMAMLGHDVHCIYSMAEFLEVVK
jgi:hypothetical protein